MAKTKVMIVEDEWVIAKDLNQCLNGLGYEVTSAEEWEEKKQ
jgi:CheY-like chemotaxis protein